MAELFAESGQSADVALSPPQLQGIFIPGIDDPNNADGFGFSTPWGGGTTARKYQDYGPSPAEGSSDTQLRDLSNALITTGNGVAYNFEGLVGPQGPPGPAGPQGVPGSGFGLYAPPGVLALSTSLKQIEALGTDVDQMIYTAAVDRYYTWALKGPTDGPGTAGNTCLDCDETMQYIVLSQERRKVFRSEDYGDNWADITPSGQANADFRSIASDASGDKLICCVYGGRVYISVDGGDNWTDAQPTGDQNKSWRTVDSNDDGTILFAAEYLGRMYRSIDSGANWTEIRPDGDTNKRWVDIACDDNGINLVAVDDNDNDYIFFSNDSGTTWTKESVAGVTAFSGCAISGNGATMVAVGSTDIVYISEDYGATWTTASPVGAGAHSWYTAAVNYSGSVILVAGSATIGTLQGAAVTSFDGGATWTLESGWSGNFQFRASALAADGSKGVISKPALSGTQTVYTSVSYLIPTWAETTITPFARTVVDDVTATEARTTLGAQTQGDVLDDLNTVGQVTADGDFLVGTAAGVFAWESGNTARTSLGLGTGDSPTWAGGTFTGVVTGVTPTADAHLATKEYVDLAIGTQIDFFFSDTASGVGSAYLMYPQETGEAQSTLNSSALGAGNDQLIFTYLSEAGQPGTEYLREGTYTCHVHLNKATGNKDVEVYYTVSYVDADGSSNETLVVTSELSDSLTDTETAHNLHSFLSNDVTTGTTKRLLIKFYANVGATGTNATVTITMEGSTDSHVSVAAPSSVWQRHGDVLDDLNTVGVVTGDDYMLVGTAAGVFAWETGATLRTSIGVDAAGTAAGLIATHESTFNHANYNTAYTHSQLTTGNPHSVTKSEIGLGNVENTALSTWAGSSNLITLGTISTGTWEATDVGIAHGGTGQSTQQAAIDALTNVAAATNEYVLTKDTVSGNAIWKAGGGGSDAFTVKIDAAATAGYIGAASSDGVLRTGTGLSYTDGGDYVTIASTGLLSDGTAGRVLRTAVLHIYDGTDADTVKADLEDMWNGDTISSTDNIGKGATVGDFSLTATGKSLIVENSGLSGTVVMAFGILSFWSGATSIIGSVFAGSGDMEVTARAPTGGAAQDLTTLLTGTAELRFAILYITDA